MKLFNKSDDWGAKIQNDRVGMYHHTPYDLRNNYRNLLKVNPNAYYVALPPSKADGFENYNIGFSGLCSNGSFGQAGVE